MARFNQNEGGLIVVPTPPKKKRKPRPKVKGTVKQVCRSCGFVGSTTARGMKVYENFDRMCRGCAGFFGTDSNPMIDGMFGGKGVTDLTLEDTLKKMDKVEEAKHVLCMKSASFGVPETGDSIGMDFGDIFHVSGFGNTKGLTPNGKGDWAMKAYTITIKIAGHTLTLFMHEVMPIHWVTIMELKKEGDYQEAYLTTEDSSGYWKPSDAMINLLKQQYGNR